MLLLVVGTLVVVGMYGNDRVYEQLQAVDAKIGELEGTFNSNQQGSAQADVDALRAEQFASISGAKPVCFCICYLMSLFDSSYMRLL